MAASVHMFLLVTKPRPLIGMKGLLMYAALNPHEFGTRCWYHSTEYIDYTDVFLLNTVSCTICIHKALSNVIH